MEELVLTIAPTSPTMRRTPGESELSTSPSARSRGQNPAAQAAQ
jgi:hypothetical protein